MGEIGNAVTSPEASGFSNSIDKWVDKKHRTCEPYGLCPTTRQPYHAIRRRYPTTVERWGRQVETYGETYTCSSCDHVIANFKRDPDVTYC